MPNVYEVITGRIIQQLESGTAPWHKPWKARGKSCLPRNLVSGREYRGINVWTLLSSGYANPQWLTFRQARQLDGHVRKGRSDFRLSTGSSENVKCRTVTKSSKSVPPCAFITRSSTWSNAKGSRFGPSNLPRTSRKYNPLKPARKSSPTGGESRSSNMAGTAQATAKSSTMSKCRRELASTAWRNTTQRCSMNLRTAQGIRPG